jgi:hypothetical protein
MTTITGQRSELQKDLSLAGRRRPNHVQITAASIQAACVQIILHCHRTPQYATISIEPSKKMASRQHNIIQRPTDELWKKGTRNVRLVISFTASEQLHILLFRRRYGK